MTTEAYYYDTINSGLSSILSGRVFPIKLPQNTVYPALLYSVDSAEADGYLELGKSPAYTFDFSNTFYASSYGQIIEITDAIREICSDENWNISGYADGNYDEALKTYSRTVNITVVSTL